MPEKNIQDDYYANISNEKDNSDNNSSKKIKIKPKVLVKKTSEIQKTEVVPMVEEPKKEERKLIIVSRASDQPKKESLANKGNTFFKRP
jgi:hypothetical protein